VDDSPIVMEFDCDGDPQSWPLRQSRVDRLQQVYPSLDVLAEVRRADAWLEAKPERRKTARGMPEFLRGWMDRAQNGGGRSRASPYQLQLPQQTILDRVKAKLATIPITDGSDKP
jgi:hypothetical protein